MNYFIDSNVFVYAKIRGRKYGKCCQDIIKKIYEKKMQAIIDNIILLGVVNALRKLGAKDIEDEILAILPLPIRIVDFKQEDIVEVTKDLSLSPYDSLHYIVSKKSNAKIISADKDFKVRIDPCNFTLDS
ncbi:PIN domain-containing protein [Stygiolobus sp. CP850M]|uniref:type II toxin-antitoxin system VapC family toxin n=1 Tax=Stygiolobus sp. CP850M TaxID=3133134 RepID=UPI00307F801F